MNIVKTKMYILDALAFIGKAVHPTYLWLCLPLLSHATTNSHEPMVALQPRRRRNHNKNRPKTTSGVQTKQLGLMTSLALLAHLGKKKEDQEPIRKKSPLYKAVQQEDYKMVMRLLRRKKADVNYQNGRQRSTALNEAAKQGNITIVKCLLNYDLNLDAQDADGKTALQYATMHNQYEMVALPLQYRAKVDVQDNKGHTALHCAAIEGHGLVGELLLKYGASVYMMDEWKLSPLHYAAAQGDPFLLERILRKQPDL